MKFSFPALLQTLPKMHLPLIPAPSDPRPPMQSLASGEEDAPTATCLPALPGWA